jgi:ubiquinone/menaquinone biosynthesis C-methylase UbiE
MDTVKQQVAAHWDRRAPTFDDDFGHSIRTPDERAAWDRILALVLGTGFLAFELAARGHRVTGVDFAPAMIAAATRKARERGVSIRFEEGDIEQLPFAVGAFDLVISRHVLWTLPHPEAAIDEWVRVLRPGGRLVVVDSHLGLGTAPPASQNARTSPEYAAVGDQLPYMDGRSREQIEDVLRAHGLTSVSSDPLLDLVAAQARRMVAEGREPPSRQRYVVWGDRGGETSGRQGARA